MKKLIIYALLSSMATPVLATSTTKNYFGNQCANAGHGWVENFTVSNIFPAQMVKTLYFGDKSGSVYQIKRLSPGDNIVLIPDNRKIVTGYLKAAVYNSVALGQPINLCVDESAKPNEVLGIYTEMQ